jgi:hypothetical protein
VKGLLARAQKVRRHLGLDKRPADETGISPDDLKQIEQDLERAVEESRMEVTPDDFKVKAAKQGVLFPVAVIASLAVALALGLGALYVLFQRGETRIATEGGATVTAEGKLIAELKKESEAQLEAKNREIDSIQVRLADIEKQRQDLQTGMDAKVKAREDELQKTVAAELETEKQKLQSQGLSDAAITKRLADLEAQKNSESAKQLETYRQAAEAERARTEASLTALSTEYNASLQKANDERQKVLADSRQREEALQAQLAQSTATLETEKARAEAALRDLSAQKEKEEIASSQLVSLYSVARSDIAAQSWDRAVQSLKAIGDYVNQGEVAQLAAISKRRDVDLFVVDVLTTYVQGEKTKTGMDTSSLVALSAQVADLKNRVAEADQLAREGRTADAVLRYSEALNLLPEAAKAQAYLAALARDAETARAGLLHDALGRAEAAFSGKRYAEALSLWKQALAYLPESADRVSSTVESIAASGAAESSTGGTREQSVLAAPLLARASAALDAKAYDDALPLYLDLLAKYPLSSQAALAVQGIGASAKGLNDRAAADYSEREAALARQLSDVQQQLAASVSGNRDLSAKLVEANQVISAKEADAASLSAKLADAEARAAAAQKALSDAQASGASRATVTALTKQRDDAQQALAEANTALADRDQSIARLQRELATAQEAAGSVTGVASETAVETALAAVSPAERVLVESLQADYSAYQARMAALNAKALSTSVLEQGKALGFRNTFLATTSMQKTFPGLGDTIRTYDEWWKAEGRNQVVAIVTDLFGKATRTERRAYLDSMAKKYASDPEMIALLKKLEPLVGTN